MTFRGAHIKRVDIFWYLGSVTNEMGNVDVEVTNRIHAEWKNWKAVTDILCGWREPVRLKRKMYKLW